MEISQKLTVLMESVRASQSDVARAAGMAPNAISRVLAGNQRLYLDQAQRIAAFLGVSVDYLADDALDEPRRGPDLTEDERFILRLAKAIGVDQSLQRLANPPIIKYGRSLRESDES